MGLLSRERAALVVVDVQEGFRPVIDGFEDVVRLVVKRIQNVALDPFGPTRVFEDLFRGANVNVEIDE